MKRHLIEILGSGLFVYLTVNLLEGRVIWTLIQNWTRGLGFMAAVVIVFALFGAIFSLGAGVKLRNFVVGAFASFFTWAVYYEATTSPFYRVDYGSAIIILIGFVLGAVVVESAERRGHLQRFAVFQ